MERQDNAARQQARQKAWADERSRDRKRRNAAERQRKCRARRRGVQIASTAQPNEGEVSAREIRRGAQRIIGCIDETLQGYRSAQDRGQVMQRVFSYTESSSSLGSSCFPVGSQGSAHSDILSGLKQSLSEVKSARTAAELGTKHAILTAVVSGSSTSSLRGQARLLQVYPRNVALAIARRKIVAESYTFKCTLSKRKQRSDVLDEASKAAVLSWWASETRNSPNSKEVIRKRQWNGAIDTKPTQYLMESQVGSGVLQWLARRGRLRARGAAARTSRRGR